MKPELEGIIKRMADEATIKTHSSSISALQTSVASLQSTVVMLQSQITTTTASATPVSVALVPNAFTGSSLISFAGLNTNSTIGNSFTFNLTNSTGKTITNVQLAIGLELLDSNQNVISAGLPITVTLTSSGLSTIWAQQTTGYPYILGFTNTATTGLFGGIGVITQATGTTSYTINVTVVSGSTAIPAFYIYPVIKVQSYS